MVLPTAGPFSIQILITLRGGPGWFYHPLVKKESIIDFHQSQINICIYRLVEELLERVFRESTTSVFF